MTQFDVTGLHAIAEQLAALAAELGVRPGLLSSCPADGTGEGDTGLAPSEAVAIFRARWAAQVMALETNATAVAATLTELPTILSKLDDETGF